ncbi:hypothetical protein ACU6VI_15710 [Sphaerotilus natans]|uniref:hypothetical protein n=1 Tax=Sphaerotilus natans TaxID=34103 RepID=UPI00406C9E8C
MNIARPARPSLPRAARLVLLAALSAGALGLSGCGGGVSVGVGIEAGYGSSHDAPPTVSMSLSTASGAGGTTVRLSASPRDDYAITQVDFEMVYPGGAVQHLGSVRRPPWVLDISLPYGTGGSVLSLRARAWDDAGQSGLSGWSGISVY